MNRIVAKHLINDEIKGYKLQRDNEIFNKTRFYETVETFRINSANIAMLPAILPAEIILAGLYGISLGVVAYECEKFYDPITKKIDKLKAFKKSIFTTGVVDDMTDDEFEQLTNIKVYTK